MALLDKLNFAAKTATEKANEAIGSGKLTVKIKKEEYNIEEQYKKIGAYYYAKRCEGLELEAEAEAFCLTVDLSKAAIAELQEQMKDLKTAPTAVAPVMDEPVEAPVFSELPCPNCGAAVTVDAQFCPKCGGKLY